MQFTIVTKVILPYKTSKTEMLQFYGVRSTKGFYLIKRVPQAKKAVSKR